VLLLLSDEEDEDDSVRRRQHHHRPTGTQEEEEEQPDERTRLLVRCRGPRRPSSEEAVAAVLAQVVPSSPAAATSSTDAVAASLVLDDGNSYYYQNNSPTSSTRSDSSDDSGSCYFVADNKNRNNSSSSSKRLRRRRRRYRTSNIGIGRRTTMATTNFCRRWQERVLVASREWRHNPCLMNPTAAFLLFAFLAFSLLSLLFQFPTAVLGFALGPVLRRFPWVIEFLYPTALGRWIHLTLVGYVMRGGGGKGGGVASGGAAAKPHDKNRGFHSRTLEQRVEVIPNRVYVHPLPQFLDNLGYLVVCLPPETTTTTKALPRNGTVLTNIDEYDDHDDEDTGGGGKIDTPLGKVTVKTSEPETPIVGFVVDCGQSDSVLRQIDFIANLFYGKRPIAVQSIASTHKHHDHTAGNKPLTAALAETLKLVFGGAVEKVPGCNFPLADGDLLPLPKSGNNDMNDVVEVEAVATPGHTRGSIAYVLRPKQPQPQKPGGDSGSSSGLAFIFTGDTLFSGGNGVPFEADFEYNQELKVNSSNATSPIRASASNYAIERCFSEILARCTRSVNPEDLRDDRVLLFPGHEYTSELLARQLSSTSTSESCKWKHMSPAAFFETASQYYVAIHRRALPHSSGKLLSAPTSLRRELLVNPQLRLLSKRGEFVLRAVHLWYTHFSKTKSDVSLSTTSFSTTCTENSNGSGAREKGVVSTHSHWNLDAADVDRPVFATLYATQLDDLLADLDAMRVSPASAAQRLRAMKRNLEKPPIARRPVPDTLPSDRSMYKSLLGFVLLGSSPSALTLSDSEAMKLPKPTTVSSDAALISKTRLLKVLRWLGFLNGGDGPTIETMLDQLWKETREYSDDLASFQATGEQSTGPSNEPRVTTTHDDMVDVEVEIRNGSGDEVTIGALRWIIFGIPQKPPSWLAKYCLPCCTTNEPTREQTHPVELSRMKQHAGELVRHDVFTCPLCRSAAGCPVADDDERVDELRALKPTGMKTLGGATAGTSDSRQLPVDRPSFRRSNSSATYDDDQSVEITQATLNSLLREA